MKVTPPLEPMTLDLSQLSDADLRWMCVLTNRLAHHYHEHGQPRGRVNLWLDLSAELDERLTQRRKIMHAAAIDLDGGQRGRIVAEDQVEEHTRTARQQLREALFRRAFGDSPPQS